MGVSGWLLVEVGGAGDEVGAQALALGGVERGEHLFFDGGDNRGRASKALGAAVGEAEALVAPAAVTVDELEALERGEQLVHRLAGDERAASELGVGEPGPVGELLKTRVLRDGQVVFTQGGLHRRPQGDLGAFEHVPDGCVEIHLTHVNILTYIGCQHVDKP